jgi:hypothetical protein
MSGLAVRSTGRAASVADIVHSPNESGAILDGIVRQAQAERV